MSTTSGAPFYSCSCENTSVLNVSNLGNISNSTNSTSENTQQSTLYYLGLGLALGNCLLVGTSYVLQKKALNSYQRRTGHTGKNAGLGYMREWLWWVGLLLMGCGELANFLAFGFAPASLVTPLEGLTVVVSCVLASIFLHENLNVYGQIGIYLCLVGSLIIVLLAPEEREITTMVELERVFMSPAVITIAAIIVTIMVLCGAWLGPRWGHRNPFIFLAIAAVAGPVTVFGCKAIGLAISDTAAGTNQFTYWLTWVMIVLTIICILLQLYYVNRTLASFSTCVVTPVYFVMFTTAVLISSGLAFSEFAGMTAERAIVMVCGFLVIAAGVILINIFKNEDCTWRKVAQLFRVANEAPSGAASESSVMRLGDANSQSAKKSGGATAPFRKLAAVMNRMKKRRKLSDEADPEDVAPNGEPASRFAGATGSSTETSQRYAATSNEAIDSDDFDCDEKAIVHDKPTVGGPFVRLDESVTSMELRTALNDVNSGVQMDLSPAIMSISSTSPRKGSKRFSGEKRRRPRTSSKEIVVADSDDEKDDDQEPGGAAEQQNSRSGAEAPKIALNGIVHYRSHRKFASDFGTQAEPAHGKNNWTRLDSNGSIEGGLRVSNAANGNSAQSLPNGISHGIGNGVDNHAKVTGPLDEKPALHSPHASVSVSIAESSLTSPQRLS